MCSVALVQILTCSYNRYMSISCSISLSKVCLGVYTLKISEHARFICNNFHQPKVLMQVYFDTCKYIIE